MPDNKENGSGCGRFVTTLLGQRLAEYLGLCEPSIGNSSTNPVLSDLLERLSVLEEKMGKPQDKNDS